MDGRKRHIYVDDRIRRPTAVAAVPETIRARRPKQNRRVTKIAKRVAFGTVAVVAITALVITGSGLLDTPPNGARISSDLQAPKKLFTADEQPTFHLKLQNRSTALMSFVHPTVYADSQPTVTVVYKDRKVDVASTVTPETGGYKVTISAKEQMRPGSYTVSISGDSGAGTFKASQTFAWGVLAINTTKATYSPGEQATIQMGVLSSEGHTICDAPIVLYVTDPAGSTAKVPYAASGDCKGDNFTVSPDYSATYTTTTAGTYTMHMQMADTKYEVTDTFQVKPNEPFNIARSGPTRVFPSSGYGMGLSIHADKDFKGTVRETLPDSRFKVLSSPGATVDTTAKDKVVLSYAVDWKAGQDYTLNYQFKVPPVSPAFYYVGPLTLTDSGGNLTYREARAWQIAGDAAITFVKETVLAPGAVNSSTDSVTSTTGNALIITFNLNTANLVRCLGSVTDSASNTWVVPTANPSTNPAQNGTTTSSSVVAMAYAVNTTAITTITVTQCGTAIQDMAYNVEEFSGIDNTNPVYDSQSGHNDTATTSYSTGTVTLALCDQPTTDQLMRGGEYFCTDTSVLAIGIVFGGSENSASLSGGYTALTPQVANTGTASVRAFPAYSIISSSGSTSFTITVGAARGYGWGFMAFRVSAATDPSQAYFWAM